MNRGMKNIGAASAAIVLVCLPWVGRGQKAQPQTGRVSYVTSSSIYVKFDNTEAILVGDTLSLWQAEDLVPALVVQQKSSISIVGKPIGDLKLVKGNEIYFSGRELKKRDASKTVKKPIARKKDNVKGLVSVASYLTGSSATDFNARNMARIRFSANNIHDSRFSVSTYMIYRQNLEASEDSIYQSPGLFNVYNLFLKYEKVGDYSIGLGRKINRRVASLGMVDGLHAEKQLGMFHVGGIAGFRPDPHDNSFNTDLQQMGGYFGASQAKGKVSFETTVGLLEQRNGQAVDRRYIYGQTSASVGNNFNLFSSAEMDLYSLNTDLTQGGSRLTNLHISSHFRVHKSVRLSVSYDTRRQIIFYETYRTYLERLIADDEARQGIRARINWKPMKGVNVGLSYGKRYQNSLQNASDNYNAYASIRNLPVIGGLLSGNINVNQSAYLNSASTTIRHNRFFFKNKVNVSNYLRTVVYTYNPERETTIVQQFLGTNMNYTFGDKWSAGVLAEFSLRKAEYKGRINLRLTKRF